MSAARSRRGATGAVSKGTQLHRQAKRPPKSSRRVPGAIAPEPLESRTLFAAITTVPTPDKPIGKPDTFTAVAGQTLQHTSLENGLTRYMYTADGVTRRYDDADTGDFTLWWSQGPELGVVAATYKVTNYVKQQFRFGPRQGEQLKEGSYGPTVDVTNPLHASRPGMSIWGLLPDGRSLVGGQFKVLQFVPGQTKPSRLAVE